MFKVFCSVLILGSLFGSLFGCQFRGSSVDHSSGQAGGVENQPSPTESRSVRSLLERNADAKHTEDLGLIEYSKTFNALKDRCADNQKSSCFKVFSSDNSESFLIDLYKSIEGTSYSNLDSFIKDYSFYRNYGLFLNLFGIREQISLFEKNEIINFITECLKNEGTEVCEVLLDQVFRVLKKIEFSEYEVFVNNIFRDLTLDHILSLEKKLGSSQRNKGLVLDVLVFLFNSNHEVPLFLNASYQIFLNKYKSESFLESEIKTAFLIDIYFKDQRLKEFAVKILRQNPEPLLLSSVEKIFSLQMGDFILKSHEKSGKTYGDFFEKRASLYSDRLIISYIRYVFDLVGSDYQFFLKQREDLILSLFSDSQELEEIQVKYSQKLVQNTFINEYILPHYYILFFELLKRDIMPNSRRLNPDSSAVLVKEPLVMIIRSFMLGRRKIDLSFLNSKLKKGPFTLSGFEVGTVRSLYSWKVFFESKLYIIYAIDPYDFKKSIMDATLTPDVERVESFRQRLVSFSNPIGPSSPEDICLYLEGSQSSLSYSFESLVKAPSSSTNRDSMLESLSFDLFNKSIMFGTKHTDISTDLNTNFINILAPDNQNTEIDLSLKSYYSQTFDSYIDYFTYDLDLIKFLFTSYDSLSSDILVEDLSYKKLTDMELLTEFVLQAQFYSDCVRSMIKKEFNLRKEFFNLDKETFIKDIFKLSSSISDFKSMELESERSVKFCDFVQSEFSFDCVSEVNLNPVDVVRISNEIIFQKYYEWAFRVSAKVGTNRFTQGINDIDKSQNLFNSFSLSSGGQTKVHLNLTALHFRILSFQVQKINDVEFFFQFPESYEDLENEFGTGFVLQDSSIDNYDEFMDKYDSYFYSFYETDKNQISQAKLKWFTSLDPVKVLLQKLDRVSFASRKYLKKHSPDRVKPIEQIYDEYVSLAKFLSIDSELSSVYKDLSVSRLYKTDGYTVASGPRNLFEIDTDTDIEPMKVMDWYYLSNLSERTGVYTETIRVVNKVQSVHYNTFGSRAIDRYSNAVAVHLNEKLRSVRDGGNQIRVSDEVLMHSTSTHILNFSLHLAFELTVLDGINPFERFSNTEMDRIKSYFSNRLKSYLDHIQEVESFAYLSVATEGFVLAYTTRSMPDCGVESISFGYEGDYSTARRPWGIDCNDSVLTRMYSEQFWLLLDEYYDELDNLKPILSEFIPVEHQHRFTFD